MGRGSRKAGVGGYVDVKRREVERGGQDELGDHEMGRLNEQDWG